MKVVNEFVHITQTPEQITAEEEQPLLIEWQVVRWFPEAFKQL